VSEVDVNGLDMGGAGVGRWRRRHRVRVAVGTGAALAVLGVVAAATVGLGGRAPAGPAPSARPLSTVHITRQTLVDYVTVDGAVGYGATVPVQSRAAGTVTWLPPAGSTVAQGQSLLRVDDQPVVLLYGQLPIYRPLAEPATGRDVAQFEANLRALGYSGFTVDDSYSAATTAAVKQWQHDLGVPETGKVGLGQVIYSPGPVRIAQQLVRVGAVSPADVVAASGTTRFVTSVVQIGKSDWAVPGATVTVTLPGGRVLAGTVAVVTPPGTAAAGTDIGTQGSQDSGGQDSGNANTTVQITIRIPDQKALGTVQQGSVEVRYAAKTRQDVLTVPVGALLALAEGGYGVEVVDGGSSRVVAVETGLFAAGRVEVRSTGIRAGMTVRVPQ
jgi:hypothetical protein